ncbi:Hypothetical predicted protein [Paramuricea clavata]|uniref:Uncharacterized protein n=1 Tax=Paramuricea clavata TaxID=317549 RepID=A0A6S7L9P0_PARCT|nr:Hypothetical predicted protein [Paramuricea clavata]
MSACGNLVVHDGRYKFKGSKDYVSNFTIRFLYPVEVGNNGSGYVGVATHKDGIEKRFFCRITSFTKLSEFTKELNYNSPALKNYMIELTNSRLNKLLTELSDRVTGTDESEIPQAVRIIGKNYNRAEVPIWVLNEDVAIDAEGQLVDPKDFRLVWLGQLTNGDGVHVAKHEHACNIKLPLGFESFDIMCHFLNGSLGTYISGNQDIRDAVNTMLPTSLQYTARNYEEENADGTIITESGENSRSNFLSQFFIISSAAIVSNFAEWQKLIGFCPLVIAIGSPGCGKTKAGNVAIACTGSYPTQFYNLFTDAYNGQVASMTSMGFQADDPTDPAEVGKAAKRFFSDGSSGNCFGQKTPKCSPIFTVNKHVIKWLLHPERQR